MYIEFQTTEELKDALRARAESALGFVHTYAAKIGEGSKKALFEMEWRHDDAMQKQCRHDTAATVLQGIVSMESRGNDLDAILEAIRWSLLREILNWSRDVGTSSNGSANRIRRFMLAERADLYHDLFGMVDPPALK